MPTPSNPFNSRTTLKTSKGTYTYFDLNASNAPRSDTSTSSLLHQGPPRIHAPQRRQLHRPRTRMTSRASPTGTPKPRQERKSLHARPRRPPGLHRRPCVVDLAAMREAMKSAATQTSSTPGQVRPGHPCDHSVQVDAFAPPALTINAKPVPSAAMNATSSSSGASNPSTTSPVPATGIVHQVNPRVPCQGCPHQQSGNDLIRC